MEASINITKQIPYEGNVSSLNAPEQIRIKGLFIFLLIVFHLVLFFAVGFKFVFANLSDKIVAYSIPEYPNAKGWNIYSSVDIENGSSGGASFETEDKRDRVFNYYKEVLPQKGWELYVPEYSYKYSLYFRKYIGGVKFVAIVSKSEPIYKKWRSNEAGVGIVHGRY